MAFRFCQVTSEVAGHHPGEFVFVCHLNCQEESKTVGFFDNIILFVVLHLPIKGFK